MPAGIRKAEIDIRNGSLIRLIDDIEQASGSPSPTPTPTPKVAYDDPNAAAWETDEPPPPQEVFVTDVPAEFRRIELFISGTTPNKAMLPLDEDGFPIEDTPSEPNPTPSQTPITGTWQETLEDPRSSTNQSSRNRQRSPDGMGFVTVVVCPITGMRATSNCPRREAKSLRSGTEPKEFCSIHTKAPE